MSTATDSRVATVRVRLDMSTTDKAATARPSTGTETTSFSASVFAKYVSTRRRSWATSRVRIASWPNPASTVTSAAKERPNVKTPNADSPSFRAITMKNPTETIFEPMSAAAR